LNNKEKQILEERLENAFQNGVALFLEGTPALPSEIAGKCVGEDTVYMADYVLDDKGILRELRYDRVSCWK